LVDTTALHARRVVGVLVKSAVQLRSEVGHLAWNYRDVARQTRTPKRDGQHPRLLDESAAPPTDG
jgi:hypothetical protein